MKILLITPDDQRRPKLTRWRHRHHACIVGLRRFRGVLPRVEHRQEGIVRDFWDLGNFLRDRRKLANLLQAPHEKTWRPDAVFPPVPSFADYVERTSSERYQ